MRIQERTVMKVVATKAKQTIPKADDATPHEPDQAGPEARFDRLLLAMNRSTVLNATAWKSESDP